MPEFHKRPARASRLISKHTPSDALQGGPMPTYLRVFPRDADTDRDERQAPTVNIRLGDLFPLLAQAHRGNYLWLNDFEDDEVCISPDLYEVLQAFRAYRPAA